MIATDTDLAARAERRDRARQRLLDGGFVYLLTGPRRGPLTLHRTGNTGCTTVSRALGALDSTARGTTSDAAYSGGRCSTCFPEPAP